MSDEKKDTTQQDKKAEIKPKLPPQSSPQDTSNWDDREFMTPTGRVVIETREDADKDNVIAE